MGDPRRPRRTYSTPRSPWSSDQLAQELYLVGSYGLRNKRELYKAQSQLSSIRKQARHLLAAPAVERTREEGKLLNSLLKKGLLSPGMILDDVLSLSVEDMLSRRLQTVIYKRGSAVTPAQARQLIVHRHVKIGERVVSVPGYHVTAEDEQKIVLTGGIGVPKLAEPKMEAAPAPAAGPEATETPAPSQ